MLHMLTVNSYLEMNNSLNTHLESAKYLRNHVTKKKNEIMDFRNRTDIV